MFTSLPETLPTIDADFTIQFNASWRFSMSTTGTFDYYRVQGYTQGEPLSTSLHWVVTAKAAPHVAFNFPQLPAEIFPEPLFEVKLGTGSIEELSSIASYEEYLENVLFAENHAPAAGNTYFASRARNLR